MAPELDKVIANLELMPLRMNAGKRDKIGERQRLLAKQSHAAGLLSDKGFRAVMNRPITNGDILHAARRLVRLRFF